MNAEIIAVGTELLLGDILNTNAQFLSKQLSDMGIDVFFQSVVGDNNERLKQTVHTAIGRSDITILSGGLGPTDDDLTKEMVAEYFGLPLVFHQDIADGINAYLKGNMPKSNLKQANIPEGAKILQNDFGTAPGVLIERDGKVVVLLPGPPRELEPMFSNHVKPLLEGKTPFTIVSRTLRLFGIGESSVQEQIKDLMAGANPTVAPYAKSNETTLRITAKCKSTDEADTLIDGMEQQIRARLGQYIYGYGEMGLAETVTRRLIERNITIATAESCTGGLLAGAITDVPGASGIFREGVVTYSNDAKRKYLGVREETLARVGAVSEETAREMAEGIAARAGSDIGVGITGVAGPDGGTADKPVGLVYVAVCFRGNTTVRRCMTYGDRAKVRHASVMHAMDVIRKLLDD